MIEQTQVEQTQNVKWVEALALDELWEGEHVDIDLEDDYVLLIRQPGGTIHACQGMCPHQEMALVDGEIEGTTLTCHAHLWEFDITTGKGINPDNCQLLQYPVKVESEMIYVGVPLKKAN